MAVPVALVGGKYGVMVGISLDEVPSAPGAPLGQSGISGSIWAWEVIMEEIKIDKI